MDTATSPHAPVESFEGWTLVGGSYVRPSPNGENWSIDPVLCGWALRQGDPQDPKGLRKTFFVSENVRDCMGLAMHIDGHDAVLADWAAKDVWIECEGPHGTRLVAAKAQESSMLKVTAFNGDEALGHRLIMMEGWQPAYVLGEIVVSGDSSLKPAWQGKGLGRAMYDFAEKAAGYRSTPHGRHGAMGSLMTASRIFWEKRARHQSIPGDHDPVGVEARNGELLRARHVRFAESCHLMAETAVALAGAIGGVPVMCKVSDGSMSGWAEDASGRTLTTLGWDTVPTSLKSSRRIVRGWDEVREHSDLLTSLSAGEEPYRFHLEAAAIALPLHHSDGWTEASVLEALKASAGFKDGMGLAP